MPTPCAPRPAHVLVSVALAAGVLAGCGSDPAPAVRAPNLATLAGGGRHYSFGGGTVAIANFPNPCTLLPTATASTLLGEPVTPQHILNSCVWSAPVASDPVLSIVLQAIGSGATEAYAADRSANNSHRPRSVRGIGDAAAVYRPNVRTTVAAVRTRQVYFTVSLTSSTNQTRDEADYQLLVERVARLAARQFSG